ncbi:MAG: serine/threonine-protein kinase [Elusimicrobiota bacterium]|nr:serine/threonine-protein kinase [Elusimicrobiota bacterium]
MPDPENIQSLMRGEKYEEAREILARKKHLDLTDYDLFLEIYIKLGDFMRAKLTANQIAGEIQNQPGSCEYSLYLSLADNCREKGEAGLASQLRQIAVDRMLKAGSVSDAPQTIYELAAAMEKEGETALALKIYRQFADAGKDYLDATERYKILNTKPAAKDGPQPRFTPGPSPIKTGVQIGGQVLDNRYELKSTLGEGGMGVVYEAWDRKAGQTVAVKRMHSYLKEYPEEYGRFRKEAEIVGRLKHPNIVCIHELLEQAGEIYLVFDYVAGKTLNDVLKERKGIPLQECKDIFNGVCDAVSYAHKNNVIHRDLKPANIMLAGPTRALVMDFGLASELREGLTRVTHQTMSGTPAFMAPEQHAGIVKRECDIYAMGVCLYEMLTGVLPFEGLDVLKQKKSKDYREASTLVTWLPPGVDEVISRALEPEPTMRFADAMDFWSALKDL